MKPIKITEKDNTVILRYGRKKWATISKNKNPEYNWCIYLKGFALSGYATKQEAIDKAINKYESYISTINKIIANNDKEYTTFNSKFEVV
jgi:hypothetical protein